MPVGGSVDSPVGRRCELTDPDDRNYVRELFWEDWEVFRALCTNETFLS